MSLARVVLVTGGRDYRNAEAVCSALNGAEATLVIHGGARGADRLAADWAKYSTVHAIRVDALWDLDAKRAGPLRNGVMVAVCKALGGRVIAFPGGKDTADCVRQARAAGLEVREVRA